MNRKQAERKSEKWLDRRAGLNVSFNKDGNLVKDYAPASLASLLLRIDKAAYKRGVKDGEANVWSSIDLTSTMKVIAEYDKKFNLFVKPRKMRHAK